VQRGRSQGPQGGIGAGRNGRRVRTLVEGRTVRLVRKNVRRSLRYDVRESPCGRESDSVDWVPPQQKGSPRAEPGF
jgi:predicted RNase H-like nuclease (RuvC/YqgF family)